MSYELDIRKDCHAIFCAAKLNAILEADAALVVAVKRHVCLKTCRSPNLGRIFFHFIFKLVCAGILERIRRVRHSRNLNKADSPIRVEFLETILRTDPIIEVEFFVWSQHGFVVIEIIDHLPPKTVLLIRLIPLLSHTTSNMYSCIKATMKLMTFNVGCFSRKPSLETILEGFS